MLRKPDGESEILNDEEPRGLLRLAEEGELEWSELIEAYKENLELAMEEVERMLDQLEGKTIITSDHGELLGEKKLVGHPLGHLKAKQLREVPWHIAQE